MPAADAAPSAAQPPDGPPVAGAVLTGGRSRRMGQNKALARVDGVPMARRVVDALAAGGCDPVVLVGGDPAALEPIGAPVVADLVPDVGPLGGIATALRTLGGPVLVVACDLPLLTPAVVAAVLRAAAAAPGCDAVVARTDRLEPGFALWRPSALLPVGAALDRGERAVHRVLRDLHVLAVPVPADAVRNVNTDADLRGLPAAGSPGSPGSPTNDGADRPQH